MSETLGPVSAACTAEVRELARKQGIVVWLDRETAYSELADTLAARHAAGDFDVPVLGFRGSYLEMMLQLEGLAGGVSMAPLVVHVPGLTEEDMRTTPLLEVYRAGKRHRRALPTLVREAAHGVASAEDIEAFVARDGLTLADADEWLAGYRTIEDSGTGPDLSILDARALFEALRRDGVLAAQIAEPAMQTAVTRRASELLGIPDGWQPGRGEPQADSVSPLDQASRWTVRLAEWSMCVEFVDDLKRAPIDEQLTPLAKLAKPFVRASRELAEHLRERHPVFYVARADELESYLIGERSQATAADLGRIDTFRFEDQKLLAAAVDAIEDGHFERALEWSKLRTGGFWTQRDLGRRLAWGFAEVAARLGLAMQAAGGLLKGASSLADAAVRYAERGHTVDRHHRQLEQAWQQPPLLELDEFPALRRSMNAMRRRYRAWADEVTVAFNGLCQAHGFLPSSELQQRHLFDEVVSPWAAQDGVTAYFMVDALRYEMAAQLAEAMQGSGGGDIVLKHRFAELPTLTEVGMNVLAPVCDGGKLRPEIGDKIKGFRSGEARVHGPESRRKAMQLRVGGDACPLLSLEEVLSREGTSLRNTLTRAHLLVVHCEGIDKSGEKGVGLSNFERELQKLRGAWRRLHEAGVTRFVFTADHGFLLHDSVTRNPRRHGKKTTPHRRHVISELPASHTGEVRVSSTELGYEGDEVHFLFPEDAAPFEIGEKAKDFVHGGNSLQERLIPVLTVQHRYKAGGEAVRYRFEAAVQPPLAGMHCIEASVVEEAQTALSFGGRQKVEVTLECEDTTCRAVVMDVRRAEHDSNVIQATVGSSFEVYFRVMSERDERVRVRLAHATGSESLTPLALTEHFDAELQRVDAVTDEEGEVIATAAEVPAPTDWLDELPEGGVRRVFEHLAEHGTVNEADATRLLGGGRQYRAFSRKLEEYAKLAPFRVRVDVSAGVKCYVRGEG